MRLVRLVGFCALVGLSFGCEDKKKTAAPAPGASGEGTSGGSTEPTSKLVALPPGVTSVDAGEAPVVLIKTGVCSFQESGYDGQDTKSNEKIVIKIKDDKIVAAEYTYRGSHALDGKTESLSVPVREGQWLEFEFPMNSGGSKTFKAKIKKNDVEFKGIASQSGQGSCTWVEATEEETDAGKDDKKKDPKKDKAGKKK